ncbi:MAG: hypothetical protein JST51_00910 [Armatimonadetes bacterium]|nr:hypothetical protein [Armatimonadota bacterium]
MRKLFSICIVLSAVTAGFAQDQAAPAASQASEKYREYRNQITEPKYGLAKVKKLIKAIKPDGEDNVIMANKTYNTLSVEEKFTYNALHGEVFSQNCDVMPPMVDEEKKIFGHLPGNFGDEEQWSERQLAFFKKYRSKVVSLLRETMTGQKHVGLNLKHIVIEIQAYELIPDMIKLYGQKHYDQDILTVLMDLMHQGKYTPFMKSQSCEKLFGDASNYRSFIVANPENQALVIERATAYYKTKRR